MAVRIVIALGEIVIGILIKYLYVYLCKLCKILIRIFMVASVKKGWLKIEINTLTFERKVLFMEFRVIAFMVSFNFTLHADFNKIPVDISLKCVR